MKKLFVCLTVMCSLAFNLPGLAESAPKALNGIAAVVNNEIITETALNHQLAMIKTQLAQQNQPLPNPATLRKQVLNRLIDQKLQLAQAKQNHIDVTDAQINQAISNIAKQNNISLAVLKEQVVKQGMDFKDYRRQIHEQMLIAEVQRAAVNHQIKVSAAELKKAMKKAAAKIEDIPEYHLKAILVPVANNPSPEQLAQSKIKAQSIITQLNMGKNFRDVAVAESAGEQALEGGDMGWKQLTQLPAPIAAQIAAATAGSIIGPIQSPNGFYIIKVENIRSKNASHQVTLTHVQHILLKQDDLETGDQVKAKLQAILAKIQQGASFKKIAKQFSQDKNTSAKGGDLGWVTAQELPGNLAQAMQSLAVGQVSQPIRTENGWELIKVLGRKSVNNSQKHLENQVRQMIYMRKFNQAVNNWVHKLREESYVKIMS